MFGILPSFEGSLQRLGIGADGVRTTPLSGEPDLLRGPAPEADRLLQMGVEATYRRFIALVARARRLPPARVDEIGQGRVWDGGTARQLGLVDRFGSLDDAVAEAARRAKLDAGEARPVYLEEEPDFWEQLFADLADDDDAYAEAPRDAFARLAHRPEAMIERAIHDAQRLLAGPAIQARCLECPSTAPIRRARRAAGLAVEPAAGARSGGDEDPARHRRRRGGDRRDLRALCHRHGGLVRDRGARRRTRWRGASKRSAMPIPGSSPARRTRPCSATLMPAPSAPGPPIASPSRPRVYIADSAHRRGIGTLLYRALLPVLEAQGFAQAIAAITLPNEASVRLHEALGFRQVGTYERVGFKFREWRSVGLWQRQLLPLSTRPEEPRPVSAVWSGG